VGIHRSLLPLPVLFIWLATIVAAICIRLRRRLASERCARTGLVILSCYLLAVFAASMAALARGKADLEAAIPGSNIDLVRTSVSPHPAQPWRFDVLLQTNNTLSQVHVDFLKTDAIVKGATDLNLNDPALNKIKGTFQYRAWMSFARHPYVLRDGNVLILGDMRFKMRGNDWSALPVPVPVD